MGKDNQKPGKDADKAKNLKSNPVPALDKEKEAARIAAANAAKRKIQEAAAKALALARQEEKQKQDELSRAKQEQEQKKREAEQAAQAKKQEVTDTTEDSSALGVQVAHEHDPKFDYYVFWLQTQLSTASTTKDNISLFEAAKAYCESKDALGKDYPDLKTYMLSDSFIQIRRFSQLLTQSVMSGSECSTVYDIFKLRSRVSKLHVLNIGSDMKVQKEFNVAKLEERLSGSS